MIRGENKLNFSGLLIGLGVFVIIGVLHPVVIKVEYHFGKKAWPIFLLLGLIACAASIFIGHRVISILMAVLGFSFFWTIRELFEQEERVEKGWFPRNPKNHTIKESKIK